MKKGNVSIIISIVKGVGAVLKGSNKKKSHTKK